jgi:hypothetical protein
MLIPPWSIGVVRRHRHLTRHHVTHVAVNLGSQHALHRETMINYCILKHVNVKCDFERSGAHWRHLAKHYILRHAMTIILLSYPASIRISTVSSNEHRIVFKVICVAGSPTD